MTSAEKYVTAAYLVVLAVVLAYVVIYAFKLQRLDREVRRLEQERRTSEEPDRRPEVVEVGRR
jgi:hypothetical protein